MRNRLIKYASTRVMREFLGGKLSPAGGATARTFLPDMERLTAGLNKGSDNILAQHGYTTRNVYSVRDTAAKLFNDNVDSARGLDSLNLDALVQRQQDKKIGPRTDPINKQVVLAPGKFVPRGANKRQREYSDALVKRHEADEVRYSVDRDNPTNGMWTLTPWSGRKGLPGGILQDHVQLATGAHNSPRVLMQESRNTALGDSKTQKYWKNLRGVGTSEREAAPLARAGVRYGETAPVGRKAINSTSKQVWQRNSAAHLPVGVGDAGKVFVSKDLYAIRHDPKKIKEVVKQEATSLLGRLRKKLPWNQE